MEADGIKLKALEGKPEYDEWVGFCFNCYLTLHKRKAGDRISIFEVKTLAEIHNLDDARDLITMVDVFEDTHRDLLKEKGNV